MLPHSPIGEGTTTIKVPVSQQLELGTYFIRVISRHPRAGSRHYPSYNEANPDRAEVEAKFQ